MAEETCPGNTGSTVLGMFSPEMLAVPDADG